MDKLTIDELKEAVNTIDVLRTAFSVMNISVDQLIKTLPINQQRIAEGFDPITSLTANEQEENKMDKDNLSIKDLQKGMKIKAFIDSVILIIDYVCVKPEHVVGTSYAIGIGEHGSVYLLTDKYRMVLYQEEKKEIKLPVICSECGRQMVIKEWTQASKHSAWIGYRDGLMVPHGLMIPHTGYYHRCECGKVWMSAGGGLVYIGNVLVWKTQEY